MTKIKELRSVMEVTQLDVAVRTRMRESCLSAIENRRTVAYPGQRKVLAEFFGIKEAELFDERGFALEAE